MKVIESEEIMQPKSYSYSKSRINNAGKRVANGSGTDEDFEVFENFRKQHSQVLNTFRQILSGIAVSRRIVSADGEATQVVQRLKRKSTIIDKIKTGRGCDLASMQDLAGGRLIFINLDELNGYRKALHRKLASRYPYVSKGKYNYVASPKKNGYRGIHDVFSYRAKKSAGLMNNGLQIEIQYRTVFQHAWATAVETHDLLTGSRLKFEDEENSDSNSFFLLASEYLARKFEHLKGSDPDIEDIDLMSRLRDLEGKTRICLNLHAVGLSAEAIPNGKNIILHYDRKSLHVNSFRSATDALIRRDYLENEFPDDDILYVRGESSTHIKSAFRNYYRDSQDFLQYLAPALEYSSP